MMRAHFGVLSTLVCVGVLGWCSAFSGEKNESGVHVQVGGKDIALPPCDAKGVWSVHDVHPEFEPVVGVDLIGDGTKEYVVRCGHPDFANKYLLRVYAIRKGNPVALSFADSAGEEYEELIIDGMVVVDTRKRAIFFDAGNAVFIGPGGDAVFLREVDKYMWSKRTQHVTEVGNKFVDSGDPMANLDF